ncbi:unnamed protein product [Rotaria magnacalcarata]|uniref:TTF-type domain-containing protein n=1 Tax=Rotaria magnacalcarata TaxID=392030 RepID=A0A816V221_9BILA|nr:unnamed protein product [Rotaria magnacalcarata]
MYRYSLSSFSILICLSYVQSQILYECNFGNATLNENCFTTTVLLISTFAALTDQPLDHPTSGVTSALKPTNDGQVCQLPYKVGNYTWDMSDYSSIMIRLDDQHITDNPTALTSLLIQSTTINLSTEAITTLLELAEITEPSTVETSPSEAAITALEVAETTGSSIVETLSTGVTRAASELVDSTVVSNTATSLIITTIIVGDQSLPFRSLSTTIDRSASASPPPMLGSSSSPLSSDQSLQSEYGRSQSRIPTSPSSAASVTSPTSPSLRASITSPTSPSSAASVTSPTSPSLRASITSPSLRASVTSPSLRASVTSPTSPSLRASVTSPTSPSLRAPITSPTDNRSFKSHWFQDRPWLEYSVIQDKAYCYYCRHYGTSTLRFKNQCNAFLNGFSNWRKALDMNKGFKQHESSEGHLCAAINYRESLLRSNNQASVIDVLEIGRSQKVKRNRERLSKIASTILLCAKQMIPLRGHRENETSNNRGNLLEIFSWSLQTDPIVKSIINSANNANYLSHQVQDELLEIMANQVRRKIAEMISGNFYALMADESRDISGNAQLSIVVRIVSSAKYVLSNNNELVQEYFLGFVRLYQFDATTLSNAIVKFLNSF